ncbi:methyltransferase family protein [Saliphagus sp. GCM10025317]
MYQIIRQYWEYTPLPEPHVAGIVVGSALHARRPWRITRYRLITRICGLALIGWGVFVNGWAFYSIAKTIGRGERQLVTTGPYSFSRNPIYVGWTMLYAGFALLKNNGWIALFLPAVIAITHWATHREEQWLEQEFGEEYRAYRRRVPPYL